MSRTCLLYTSDLTVELKEMAAADNDVAPAATPSTDYVAGWENIYGINNTEFEPGSSNVGTCLLYTSRCV